MNYTRNLSIKLHRTQTELVDNHELTSRYRNNSSPKTPELADSRQNPKCGSSDVTSTRMDPNKEPKSAKQHPVSEYAHGPLKMMKYE